MGGFEVGKWVGGRWLKDEGVFFSQNTESKENECGKHIQKRKKNLRNRYTQKSYEGLTMLEAVDDCELMLVMVLVRR